MRHAPFAALALVSLNVAACSSPNPGAIEDGPVGSVQAAVSTVGPGGATYSLPSSAAFVLVGAGTAGCDAIASTPSETFTLPTGSWSIYLTPNGCSSYSIPADAGTNVPFTLNVEDPDGGTATVVADLTNPVQTVNVTPGGTVDISFNFTTQNLGDITLGVGNVTSSIGVTTSTDAQAPVSGTITGTMTSPTGYVESAATAAESALLANPTPFNVTIGLTALGAFTPNVNDEACATFTPTITTSGATPGDTALLQEIVGAGTGTICFEGPNAANTDFDLTYSGSNELFITIVRSGAPNTSALASVMSPDGGATTGTFVLQMGATLPSPVYTGTTLALAQFQQPVSLGSVGALVIAENAGFSIIGGVSGSFAPTLQLNP
jgi:hypothetical protein